VSQETATITHATGPSIKCLTCGLRNFADAKECRRCKTDPSQPMIEAKDVKLLDDDSADSSASKFNYAWVLVLVVGGLLIVGMLYMWQSSIDPEADPIQAAAAPAAAVSEQPAVDLAKENERNQEVATEILTEVKRFQASAEGEMTFEQYEEKLKKLRVELNNKLPNFSRREPSDETFRKEIEGALREYDAAANWWKTTITYNAAINEADRKERTQKNWTSAGAHLATAEKMLGGR